MIEIARAAQLSRWLVIGLSACEPLEDQVFSSGGVSILPSLVEVDETQGTVSVTLELSAPAKVATSARVNPRGVEAQADCFHPDFVAMPLSVEWPRDETRARYEIQLVDDETAEIDERLLLEFDDVRGGPLRETPAVTVLIRDDERTELIDAEAAFGVIPGAARDQSDELQEALDTAAAAGRGVVQLAEGEYVVRNVSVAPGTSLVGHGAILLRPANAGRNVVTVSVEHSGAEDSEMTLLQGLSIDGTRDQQGAYQALEQQNAHLLFLGSEQQTAGRLRAQVQDVHFARGTGDGLAVGPNADVVACNIAAHDVFREGLSVHGGNTRLRVRKFEASATLGTCGMWLDGDIVGYEGSRTTDIELQDVSLETGDLEIDIAESSVLKLQNVVMGAAPFRLSAPASSVRITASVLWLGIPSERHNHWENPDDVEVTDTTIIASESADEDSTLQEADREWAAIQVLWQDPETTASRLTFDACRFELAPDVEPRDHLFVAESLAAGGQLIVRGGELVDCPCDWLAPNCEGCQLEP